MTAARALAGACLCALLAACAAVGPDYHLPENAAFNAPAAQKPFLEAAPKVTATQETRDDWWRLYDDPQLNALVGEALAANTTLRVAAANLERSRAVAQEAEGAREPKASVGASVARAQPSGETFLLNEPLPVANMGDVGIQASYQLDLAGGLKRAVEAADADVDAASAALDVARISIVADTAQAYVEVCAAGEELAIARHNLALQEAQHAAVEKLVASGRAMKVDIPRARHQVEQLRAALPAYAARRRIALYRLAALTGRPPAEYPRELESCERLPTLHQPIPVGDGAALLRRRPDVRQAERTLASATARIGIATAALYPSVTLGLSAGYTGLYDDLGLPQTRRWSLGPLISWTLPGSEEKARVRQADANAAAALARFDTVVLEALRETESALTLLAHDMDRAEALRRARDQAAEARRQVGLLYRAGRLGFLDDLDAERSLAAAETALAAARTQVANDQLRLFLALGGGWQSAGQPAPVKAGLNP